MKRALIGSILGLAFALSAFAQDASALTISPARLEVSGDPGSTVEGDFILVNEQEGSRTFYSSSENFEAQGDSGTPTFTQSKEGLAAWISAPSEVTLSQNEQKKVRFSIHIPNDADPGGHFAAIFMSTTPPKSEGGQVSVGAKIGMLILLRVSGDIKEGGGITDFDTKDKGSFYSSLPIGFVYRFNNTGGDRINPVGNLVVSNMVGMDAATIDANPSKGNILPGSTRRFDVVWGDQAPVSKGFFSKVASEWNDFAFGLYTARISFEYGDSGKAEASKTVFVLPWHLLLVLLAGLAVVALIFIQAVKRYNAWIIRKAQSSSR